MAKHVVAKTSDIQPGERLAVAVKGRPVVVFNLGGDFFALLNRCPHQSAELSRGITAGINISDSPGSAECIRTGEFIRCPWHGWEFDIRTGQSWCSPDSVKVRQFEVKVEPGTALLQGPFKAETIPVTVEGDYVVVEV